MKDIKGTKGFLVNCIIEGIPFDSTEKALFTAEIDPISGIEYCVARLDRYKITKIK